MTFEQRALSLWAALAAFALWAPAVATYAFDLPLQPMDLVLLSGIPLIAVYLRRIPAAIFGVLGSGLAAMGLGWAMAGGEPLILGWSLIFAWPFVVLVALVASDSQARAVFIRAFLIAAALSAALFLAQIIIGAEYLDFRNNPAFRLPPQYGRGFALFPEVSVFAAHTILAIGIVATRILHIETAPMARVRLMMLGAFLIVALLLTRSTTTLVLLPIVLMLALSLSTRASLNTLLLAGVLALLLLGLLGVFIQSFYAERLASASAERSASMRLASILGGLSVLTGGEFFGVGIGENAEIRGRAYQIGRALGLSFGNLPDGVNSQVIGRIFEEGWPAVLHFSIAASLLWRACRRHATPAMAALACLAAGSLLTALTVTGYRGIYTNWIWLGLPAALLPIRSLVASRPVPAA